MKINQLLEEASGWLTEHGYTKSTTYISYVRFWNGFYKSTGKGIEYSENMSRDYVSQKYGRDIMSENPSILPPKEYRIFRAFRALNEFHLTQAISGTSMAGSFVRQILPDYEKSVLERYMQRADSLEYSANTKRYTYATIHNYLLVCPLSTISDGQVLDYFSRIADCSKNTIKSMLKVLKRFHEFCLDCGILDIDYSVLFPSAKTRRNTEIPSVYTTDEVSSLLGYLKDYNENRKRNYAIAMMASVYGFRAGDISDLRLSDIDWDGGVIHIAQSKTNNALEHHLFEETGDALADYLLNERPVSYDDHVFLKRDGCALKSTSISSMVFNAYNRSDIETKGRKHGSHSLRHSMASNMLVADSGILEISNALGHASVDTTRNFYAKVDVGHLRLCGLEVPANGK